MRRIPCAWSLVTGPATEPVTLSEAKAQLRITDTADDVPLTRRIVSVRALVETFLRRGLLTQTWKMTLDEWADEIELPMADPLQSVTSIRYYDGEGAQQTLASSAYQLDTVSSPGRLYRAPDASWPTLQANRRMPIEITYVVGFSSVSEIPGDIVEGLLLALGDINEFRESTIAGSIATALPNGVKAFLTPHRTTWTEPMTEAS